MKKCPVCNSRSNIEQIPYCQECGWPTGVAEAMPKHVELYQVVLTWASQAYKENSQLKSNQASAASVMKVELQDSLDLEPLKLELASLNERIKIVENSCSPESAARNLVPDTAKIISDIQVLKKAIRDTNGFLEQQILQNQKLDTYKQNSEKILAEHHRVLQDLLKEQQRQNEELQGARSTVIPRSINQLIATPAIAEISSSLTSSNLGTSSSSLGELGLVREYNGNSQEIGRASCRERVLMPV